MASKALIRAILKDKTIYRTMLESLIADRSASFAGLKLLDLAGTRKSGYHQYLAGAEVTTVDLRSGDGVDVTADVMSGLPFPDASYDVVFLMNAIYAFSDPVRVLAEACRVLKPEGKLFIGSPFIAQEMPEPHDYVRFTDEGLARIVSNAGLNITSLDRIGDRFSSAVYAVNPIVLTPILKAVVYPMAWILDALWKKTHPQYRFPLGYLVEAKPMKAHE